MKKFLLPLLMVVAVLSTGHTAYAASHTYTCADFGTITVPCSGGVMTFTAAGQSASNSIGAYDLGSAATVYVTATVVASGGTGVVGVRGDVNDYNTNFTTVLSDTSIANGGNSSAQFVIFDNNSFQGTVGDICVSDTPGECVPTPPTPEPVSTTTSSVDQTQQNLFNAYWSFLATMFFMVWLIRSTRK